MNFIIYGIYNNDNQLLYIGSSCDYIKRKRTHLSNIKHNNTNSNIKLYQYIKNNNISIKFNILISLDNIDKNNIAIIENNLISFYKPQLNIRSAISNNRNINKEYQRIKYNYRKEIKLLMNINF
jgi:hypothetical protein